MRTWIPALFAIALLVPVPASAVTIHVPGDQPTIQAAFNVAVSGDVIELADGTFSGAGNRDIDWNGLAITIRSTSGDPALTIIDVQGSPAAPHRAFLFQSGEGAGSVLEGVTVTGGHVLGSPDQAGGAVLCSGTAAPTMRNCTFRVNRAKFGGAVFVDAGSPTFEDCDFIENHSSDDAGYGNGGGLYLSAGCASAVRRCRFMNNVSGLPGLQGSGGGALTGYGVGAVLVEDCLFEGNTAQVAAAAVNLAYGLGGAGPARLERCEFRDNVTPMGVISGSGVYSFRTTVEIVDCAFSGNTGQLGGACAFIECDGLVRGSTFEENVAVRSGGVAFVNQDANVSFEDCRFRANWASGTHSSDGGGAVLTSTGTDTWFTRCIFQDNEAPRGAAVRGRDHSRIHLTSCTLVGQRGSAVYFGGTSLDTMQNTIIAFTAPGPAVDCGPSGTHVISCSDFFGNAGGNAVCGTDGGQNFSADPLFCDLGAGDFSLRADSPCAPPGVTGCGLVGALPVGCGPVSVERESWARIKARYRDGAP